MINYTPYPFDHLNRRRIRRIVVRYLWGERLPISKRELDKLVKLADDLPLTDLPLTERSIPMPIGFSRIMSKAFGRFSEVDLKYLTSTTTNDGKPLWHKYYQDLWVKFNRPTFVNNKGLCGFSRRFGLDRTLMWPPGLPWRFWYGWIISQSLVSADNGESLFLYAVHQLVSHPSNRFSFDMDLTETEAADVEIVFQVLDDVYFHGLLHKRLKELDMMLEFTVNPKGLSEKEQDLCGGVYVLMSVDRLSRHLINFPPYLVE
jgi:hypothetical protein